jgi:hypothetical protein
MTQHDFNAIFTHYPELIAEMPNIFASHRFILQLAQRYQALYIEALHFYRYSPDPQHPSPFQIAHGFLANHLNAYPQLVTHIGDIDSVDIFTQENRCAQWQKVQR